MNGFNKYKKSVALILASILIFLTSITILALDEIAFSKPVYAQIDCPKVGYAYENFNRGGKRLNLISLAGCRTGIANLTKECFRTGPGGIGCSKSWNDVFDSIDVPASSTAWGGITVWLDTNFSGPCVTLVSAANQMTYANLNEHGFSKAVSSYKLGKFCDRQDTVPSRLIEEGSPEISPKASPKIKNNPSTQQ